MIEEPPAFVDHSAPVEDEDAVPALCERILSCLRLML